MEMKLPDLVPHGGRMLLLDEVTAYAAASGVLTASFTVRADNVFFDSAVNGLPGWIAIELMAQTAAACAGAYDRSRAPDASPRPGLLLGSRRVDLSGGDYLLGETYSVAATQSFHDDESGAFDCTVRDAQGRTMASCILTAYRPSDFTAFIKS